MDTSNCITSEEPAVENQHIAMRAYKQGLAFTQLVLVEEMQPFAYATIEDEMVLLAPAVYSIAAFSCELFLKSLLYSYGFSVERLKRDVGHNLKDLFEALPEEERERVEGDTKIAEAIGLFPERLMSNSDAFARLRYANERDTYSFDYSFLIEFQKALAHACKRRLHGEGFVA